MNIQLIGTKCSNGMKLLKNINRAREEYNNIDNIEILDDTMSINKYRIKNIPGLLINGKIVSEGKVLTVREITRLMYQALEN